MRAAFYLPKRDAHHTRRKHFTMSPSMSARSTGLRLSCHRDLVSALASIPVPCFAFDISTKRFIAANERFEALLGYSGPELCGMTAECIRPEEDVPVFRQTLADPKPEGFVDARYVRRDGIMLAVKLHYHLLEPVNDDGCRVVARMVVVEFWRELEGRSA
jgi:PAS domain S-box-containing protein